MVYILKLEITTKKVSLIKEKYKVLILMTHILLKLQRILKV